jgi:hypothetical protein
MHSVILYFIILTETYEEGQEAEAETVAGHVTCGAGVCMRVYT